MKKAFIIWTIVAVLVVVGLSYGIYRYYTLHIQNKSLQTSLESANQALAQAEEEKINLVNALNDAASKNQAFANELKSVTQTANNLAWIQQLDPQLLEKYSKVYFLNENYVPQNLEPIETQYLSDKSRTEEVIYLIMPFLHTMLVDANAAGVNLQVASAYRSFKTQASLKASYKVTYGSGANSFSADQGYSEHQLGTALDFTTPAIGGGLTGFEKTDAYTWLINNAYKYGFILSYPPHNAYYIYEPWHWRFVGITLATYLHNNNQNFYDLDQRQIDTYLGGMFQNSSTTPTQQ